MFYLKDLQEKEKPPSVLKTSLQSKKGKDKALAIFHRRNLGTMETHEDPYKTSSRTAWDLQVFQAQLLSMGKNVSNANQQATWHDLQKS